MLADTNRTIQFDREVVQSGQGQKKKIQNFQRKVEIYHLKKKLMNFSCTDC